MNTGNKPALFYITDNGLAMAKRLNKLYPDARVLKFDAETVSKIWQEYKTLIFIMAAGIVVRTIAPLLKDKKTDPAVVVLDEKGRFSVSLLSGHLGGANERAREIANFLNSERGIVGGIKSPPRTEAVITTASDVNSLLSIDLWALDNNLIIEDWKLVPQIGARLLNSGALRVYTEIDLKLPEEFLKVSDPRFADIFITNKKDVYSNRPTCAPNSDMQCSTGDCHVKDQLYLRPGNLVLGIGCNSRTSADEIEDAVKKTLDEYNLALASIQSISTIDIKAGEPGLISFAQKYKMEIASFTTSELNSVKGVEKSEAAFKATGANAVAEPAALLAAGAEKLLVPKQKIGNVTVAAAEKESNPLSP
ncbi:MAG: cobalamin biosynthesis protein, partial [Nitrospirae bacterium]|nr:cobalamin biosynthesis protein [Nitrospirota bacterium]